MKREPSPQSLRDRIPPLLMHRLTLFWLCMTVCVVGCEEPAGHSEQTSSSPTPTPIPSELHADRDAQQTAELIAQGKRAFQKNQCTDCHSVDGAPSVGPGLQGIFGQPVQLDDGRVLKRDKTYLYRALSDRSRTVAGYSPQLMPSYEDLSVQARIAIVEYIKSLTSNKSNDDDDSSTTDDE